MSRLLYALASSRQVILLCDSWYPKKPVPGLVNEFPNLEMICNVRIDTVLYDLPSERTGKRGRPGAKIFCCNRR